MGLFDFLKKKPKEEMNVPEKEEGMNVHKVDSFMQTVTAASAEFATKTDFWYNVKPNEYKTFTERVLAFDDKQKVDFIVKAVAFVIETGLLQRKNGADEQQRNAASVCQAFVSHLMKMKLVLDDDDIRRIYEAFNEKRNHSFHFGWPIGGLVTQIEKQLKNRPMTEPMRLVLRAIRDRVTDRKSSYYSRESVMLAEKIDALIFQGEHGTETVKPAFFLGDDEFAKYANEVIRNAGPEEQQGWFMLIAFCQRASGGKPSKKFMDEARSIFQGQGGETLRQKLPDWFLFISQMKEQGTERVYNYGGREHRHTSYVFLDGLNMDVIKGLVWACGVFAEGELLFTLANLADRCYRKIPGTGPAAAGIGNACFFTLANARGLDGVGHLTRLKLRVKQSNTQTLIGKYLDEAAKKEGVTVHEIEDMAVDDFGLMEGRREYAYDDYKAVLEITGIGQTEIQWLKPDGKPQKSVPAFVKEKHAGELKAMKDTAKQVEITLTVQRDRFDRLFKSVRKMDGEQFDKYYFSHGLMSYLAKRLIWMVEKCDRVQALFLRDGRWVNASGEEATVALDKDTHFSLWHPVQGAIAEIVAWRDYFMENKIVQPLKQAFREVYILTDAETQTRTYSNRMAAHILKQHQFNSLAKLRGWKYSLLGAYDDGRDNETAEILIPDYGLKAEYWINEVNADNAMNETGIWLYVSTDQVRFLDTTTGEVVELVKVPPIVLSEVLRDVDLFVGVASVGNDPNWSDNGGLPAYRDYWQSYSFGELTEVAKTRKQILERLLPRLKIARVAEIRDKFLVVKGKLRTYKIHLGSTNILMEPNDQYLCIVPERSQKGGAESVFLPFEGDNGLSIILSKAFLLAEDDLIKDETITRQLVMR